MRHHQKSKLIILFITKMPMDIQTTQPTSITDRTLSTLAAMPTLRVRSVKKGG